VSRIYAYKRLWLRDNEPPYLAIYVGVDKNLALHQANMELVYNLVILGIACLFAMLLAWIAGNAILVEPLHKLVIATQRFGEGGMHVRTDLPHQEDELGRLAESFDSMAVMLQMKDIERRKAEEALQRSMKEALRLAKENEIVAEIGRVISSTISIEEIYKAFSEKVRELISFDRIVINLIDPEKGVVSCQYHEGIFVEDKVVIFSLQKEQ
jgi:nitrate/nitrite-specific signal transduction histidine kinase